VLTKFSKQQIATAIAILFHAIGIIGILVFKSNFIIASTPINLLLMFALILWTQPEKNTSFFIFLAAAIVIGIVVEIIGVNTQLLFGEYSYGNILGPKIKDVPFIIGINWFIIIYCCGISINKLLMKAIQKIATDTASPPQALKAVSVIVDGATIAVFFDWVMEPVAVQLGFWQWQGDGIPLYNYICWFGVSMLLLTVFQFCKFSKQNKFAIHLLMIQVLFFLLLRTFLPHI
jgi:bisanhydrobacterioruberin hydratase